MFEERKNWVCWTCMWLPSHLLCRYENLMLRIELFQNFLTDFILQNSGLNKIVLVVESTGFCNIIMLLLAQWLSLARICMGFESDYMQCNALWWFSQQGCCTKPMESRCMSMFMAKRTSFFLQELINASRWFSSNFLSLTRIRLLKTIVQHSYFHHLLLTICNWFSHNKAMPLLNCLFLLDGEGLKA